MPSMPFNLFLGFSKYKMNCFISIEFMLLSHLLLLIQIPTIAAEIVLSNTSEKNDFTEVKIGLNRSPAGTITQAAEREPVYTINVPSDGELVSKDLNISSIKVQTVTVKSDNEHVRCFFRWKDNPSERPERNDISWTFKAKSWQMIPEITVKRVYCYDNSRYVRRTSTDLIEDTFDLFLDNRRGHSKLIRLPLPEGETVVELDLEATYPFFYEDLRYFALLSYPTINAWSYPSIGSRKVDPVCFVLTEPDRVDSQSATTGKSAFFGPHVRAKKIVCFYQVPEIEVSTVSDPKLLTD